MAGLPELQAFLEAGFDTFGAMHGAKDFLDTVVGRERALAADFNRARSAMTRSERLTFQKLLKSPFRYARRTGAAQSEPEYDPEIKTP